MSLILDRSTITLAADHLRKGELVAFPTETVYGLGADANNDKALQKLYVSKGRPTNHPVIVHLASLEQMNDWCIELPDYARILARQFWPGPMTLIVKKAKHVSSMVTGGQDTVGLRVPAHPLALALLNAFGGGIAAPSANKYGRVSSTCAEHVAAEFGDEISIVIDGGSCPIGIESTIVDVTGPRPRILRPGIIPEQDIIEYSGLAQNTNISVGSSLADRVKNIRVPGSDKSHYAPSTPMLLLDKSAMRTFLANHNASTKSDQLTYAVLALSGCDQLLSTDQSSTLDSIKDNLPKVIRKYIQANIDPKIYARELYANLRKLDRLDANYILVEKTPESSDWLAISDRLRRAATHLHQ